MAKERVVVYLGGDGLREENERAIKLVEDSGFNCVIYPKEDFYVRGILPAVSWRGLFWYGLTEINSACTEIGRAVASPRPDWFGRT